MKIWPLLMLILMLNACSDDKPTSQTSDQAPSYRLTTEFTGPDRSLGIEVGNNNKSLPVMVDTIDNGNSQWSFLKITDGIYQISPRSSGGNIVLAIDIVGSLNFVTLSSPLNNDNDTWQVTPLSNGYCRLTSQLFGQGSSLDIVNDAEDRYVWMQTSGNRSGQHWQFEQIAGSTDDEVLSKCTDS